VKYWLIIILLINAGMACSQTSIDTAYTARELVEKILLGQGVLAGNVSYSGARHAIGLYHDDSAHIGFNNGILLTTGNALYSLGPNDSPRMGWAAGSPGDRDLRMIANGRTYDAAILEFDFVTSSEKLSFRYIFASEEYLEYVGSKFNDVFGFFLTGPDSVVHNLAVLPDQKTYISVNTVNNKINKKYFVDNTYFNTIDPYIWNFRKRKVVKNKKYNKKVSGPVFNTQFDGFTVVLEASAMVEPNRLYHIKIGIADVSDAVLDSGVILESGSFRSEGEQQEVITHVFTEKSSNSQTTGTNTLVDKETTELVIYNVEFALDSYKLPKSADNIINNVYQLLLRNPGWSVTLSGHTDNQGSDEYNDVLSKRRALVVRGYLEKFGIPGDRINISFYGEMIPTDSNNTEIGRAHNRRVEFIIHKTDSGMN
jgi:outer membrane protein OmpA-like peptidoglycan-associated protein